MVWDFEQQFSVFKQYYSILTHFFTHTYFQKIQTMLLEQHYQMGPKTHKIKNPNSTFHLRATSLGATILRSKQRLEKYIWTHEHEIPSPRFHPHFRNSLVVFYSCFIVFHKKYKIFNWISTNNTTFHSSFFSFMNSQMKC